MLSLDKKYTASKEKVRGLISDMLSTHPDRTRQFLTDLLEDHAVELRAKAAPRADTQADMRILKGTTNRYLESPKVAANSRQNNIHIDSNATGTTSGVGLENDPKIVFATVLHTMKIAFAETYKRILATENEVEGEEHVHVT